MDPPSPKPIVEWDFRQLSRLPADSDSQGIHLTPAGIVLSGQNAYLHLPLALPKGAYLKSKSILICLRFVNGRESIQVGLESLDGSRSEKLAIGLNLEGAPRRGVWVLHRSSHPATVAFGPSAPIEHEIDVDIRLALVADASHPPTATFTCFRESEQYGQPARLGGAAVFQASDGILFSIQHSGSGSVLYSYVKVFDHALNGDQLRDLGLEGGSPAALQVATNPAVPHPTVTSSAAGAQDGGMSSTPTVQTPAPSSATAPAIVEDTEQGVTDEPVAQLPVSALNLEQSSDVENQSTVASTGETPGPSVRSETSNSNRIPPAWGEGVLYVSYEPPAWTIPGHNLPEPLADGERLYPKGDWPFLADKSKSMPMQVDIGTLVYEGRTKTFLVVAAVVSSGGAMVHTVESTKGLRCGYYQKCIEITMRPTADNVIRSPKGTFPQNAADGAVVLKKMLETNTTSAVGLNLNVTVNPVTGTAIGPGLTTSFAKSKKETDEVGGVARAWLAPVLSSDGAKLTWTAELGMYRDGMEYVTSNGKDAGGKLRDVPDFVKGDVGIEVQGTWQLPEGLDEVAMELSVKQVLRYSALKGWSPRPKVLKHFDDGQGSETKTIQVKTSLTGSNVQKSRSSSLPFWEG